MRMIFLGHKGPIRKDIYNRRFHTGKVEKWVYAPNSKPVFFDAVHDENGQVVIREWREYAHYNNGNAELSNRSVDTTPFFLLHSSETTK